ncbi:hypothetical protein [Marmoricola sp. RAF53]|uniref:hypothetical protein n=1 Tax=Marmoricola sp. RAF53 TaxID=3233059 RepID=UPI003F957B0C
MTAKKLLTEAVRKSGRRSTVQIAEEYARIQSPEQAATELSRLFAQGEVVMKLYLTLVLLTRQPPHELFRLVPDHYWAELLGYEELNDADPIPGAGTRRIKRALTVLASAGPGDSPMVVRTPVRGRGARFTVPIHPPLPSRAPWITIPLELWSRGWINVMSARALFVFLCLRLVLAGKPDEEGAHVSSWDRERFAIKEDTWQRGVRELELLGLVTTATARVAVDRWTTDLKLRKVYFLNNRFLVDTDSPVEPVA